MHVAFESGSAISVQECRLVTTYAASPPRWTRRSGDEKVRAARSDTGIFSSGALAPRDDNCD